MIRIITFFLIALAFLPGCKPCSNSQISPVFIGFSPTDIDTIVLRAYQPNDNYQHLMDTVILTSQGGAVGTMYTTSNDTTIVFVNDSNPNNAIHPDFDWQIFLPAKNRTLSISNITITEKTGSDECVNSINSFVQDGQMVIPRSVHTSQFWTSGYMAYIHN